MVAVTMVMITNATVILSIGSVDIVSIVGMVGGVYELHCLLGLYNFDTL